VKRFLAVFSILVVCLTCIDARHADADDFIDDALALQDRVTLYVERCRQMKYGGPSYHFYYMNETGINFENFSVKVTAFDQDGHIIDSTKLTARGLRPNVKRVREFWFDTAECSDIHSVLVEDDYIGLWENDYLENLKQTPRLVQLLQVYWSDSVKLRTTFSSK